MSEPRSSSSVSRFPPGHPNDPAQLARYRRVTISGEPPPPTLDELRARPVGRTGAELVLRLREEFLLVTWDARATVFRVTDTENREVLIVGRAGPVHSAVVHSAVVHPALAALKRWQPPVLRDGYTTWPAERQPTGGSIHAVMANDWPIAIGLGPSEAAAYKDLARIREGAGSTDQK